MRQLLKFELHKILNAVKTKTEIENDLISVINLAMW